MMTVVETSGGRGHSSPALKGGAFWLRKVRILLHRPLEGMAKTATITRTRTSDWYVSFACECAEPAPLPATDRQVGIDVGLRMFATFSTGEELVNPRFVHCEEEALAKAQRRLSKEEKGTPERATRRRVVVRAHDRIRWRRSDFAHQHSRRIVNQFDLIAVEDLSVKGMMQNHCLAKSIHDPAWAGRKFVAVNPAYTSQNCSGCGHRPTLTLADRIYACAECGRVLDRNLNASKTILSVGNTLWLRPRRPRLESWALSRYSWQQVNPQRLSSSLDRFVCAGVHAGATTTRKGRHR